MDGTSRKFIRGDTPLIVAVIEEHKDVIQLLLDHGADVNKCNTYHSTPLHQAVEQGYTRGLSLLLERGNANKNAVNCIGKTPYMLAVEHEFQEVSLQMMELLEEQDVDVEQKVHVVEFHFEALRPSELPDLHQACFENDIDKIGRLLQEGADVNAGACPQLTIQDMMQTPNQDIIRHIPSLCEIKNHYRCGESDIEPTVRKIQEAMSEVLRALDYDPESNQIQLVGSVHEGTNIVQAYDLDFLIPTKSILKCDLSTYSHGNLSIGAYRTIPSPQMQELEFTWKFHHNIYTSIKNELEKMNAELYTNTKLEYCYFLDGSSADKACSKMCFLDQKADHMQYVDIDLTFVLRLNEWPDDVNDQFVNHPLECIKGNCLDNFNCYLVPKPPHKDSIVGTSLDEEIRRQLWQICTSHLEAELVRRLPPHLKDVYFTSKCLIKKELNLPRHAEDKPFLTGYMLKMVLMRLINDGQINNESELEDNIKTLFDTLKSCFEEHHREAGIPNLPNYFIPSQNLMAVLELPLQDVECVVTWLAWLIDKLIEREQ